MYVEKKPSCSTILIIIASQFSAYLSSTIYLCFKLNKFFIRNSFLALYTLEIKFVNLFLVFFVYLCFGLFVM